MTDKDHDNNVILFPGRKLKEVEAPTNLPKGNVINPPVEHRSKKVIWGGSLLSVLFVATIMNSSLIQTAFVDDSRQIQSTSLSSSLPERNLEFEKQMAKELAATPQRGIASIGHRPSPEDHLRFGLLEGKYAVQFADGKINGLAFSNDQTRADSPKYVNDRVAFLKAYRDLLPDQFTEVHPVSTENVDGSVVETYDLVSSTHQPVAEVRFTLDRHGRLLAMKVQTSEDSE
ncbi:MAG: hypothetical protein H6626_00435 [Pseudobdellovibrionaceae bacterium]|nr:hypothetical protein [Bdellovibrionales bacterium]USN47592.1 MAG: hypothetical protein H6626_00435 [Pseudobdellovibrionaceae bacterium]